MAMGNIKDLQYLSHINPVPTIQSPPNETQTTTDTQDTYPVEPSTSSDYTLLEESGRGCRTKRKQVTPLCCPVCSVTVRESELETHYMSELSKLEKISQGSKKKMSTTNTSPSTPDAANPEVVTPEKCWETYQNVKQNRQSRLKVKSRKRKNGDGDIVTLCPVCNKSITGDLTQHVEDCLRKSENGHSSGEDEDVDVDIDVGKFIEKMARGA